MRRPTTVELMLLSAIGLWALNLTVTRYILTHGFQPLSYATVRYGLAAVIFVAITLVAERSLLVARRDLPLVVAAALVLWLNQLGFVYSLKTTSASVIALILAATPVFTALAGLLLGTEWLPRRFWVGATLSFAGVGLGALGSGGELRGDLGGVGPRHGEAGALECPGEVRERLPRVRHERGMGLRRGHEPLRDPDVELLRSDPKPHTAPRRETGGLGDLLEPQNLAVEPPRVALGARWGGDLDVVERDDGHVGQSSQTSPDE